MLAKAPGVSTTGGGEGGGEATPMVTSSAGPMDSPSAQAQCLTLAVRGVVHHGLQFDARELAQHGPRLRREVRGPLDVSTLVHGEHVKPQRQLGHGLVLLRQLVDNAERARSHAHLGRQLPPPVSGAPKDQLGAAEAATPRPLLARRLHWPASKVRLLELKQAVGEHRPHDSVLELVRGRSRLVRVRRHQQAGGIVAHKPIHFATLRGRHERLEAGAGEGYVFHFYPTPTRPARRRPHTHPQFGPQWVHKPAIGH
eukprot:6211945-Pleurochrysis_carterae.AAC.1